MNGWNVRAGVGAAACLMTLAGVTPADAGQWTERGKLDVSASAWSHGFDSVDGARQDFEVTVFRSGGFNVGLQASDYEEDGDGLEGQGALSFGGSLGYMVLRPRPSSGWEDLGGRRIDIKLWYKPQGTAVKVGLNWLVGDIEGYLQGQSRSLINMGSVKMTPTGRATSDGWIELSTGPIDFQAHSLLPAWISLEDTQRVSSYSSRSIPTDEGARALVDALEIEDLGPAAVPDAACDASTEAQACGQHGACLFGRCVDGTILYGAPPQGQVRADYLERRLQEIEIFSGVRSGRAALPQVRQRIQALGQAPAVEFWREFSAAHELLIDGHGAPPTAQAVGVYNSAGVCLGPGVADLMPGASMDPDRPAPMVFTADDSYTVGAQLQPGDVLAQVDGVPVWSWVDQRARRFYYNGDVRGRDVIVLSQDLIKEAMLSGSQLTFERCGRTDGQACSPQEVERIEVDFSAELGSLWAGQLPELMTKYSSQGCDLRFERPVGIPPSARFYEFAGWRDIDGVRHLLFNGLPQRDGAAGNQWQSSVESALASGPAALLIDQRAGYGGYIDTLSFVLGHLFEASNLATSVFMPWVGEEIEGALRQAFDECAEVTQNSGRACGLFYEVTPTDYFRTAGAAQSRLAFLNGYDVSGNDYLSRFAQFRGAPTRIFGYGPTIGAFGQSCRLPGHVHETRSMAYQCHDSTFAATRGGPEQGFESGTGVMPDEIIYQFQSDALLGRDTMLEAARAWLNHGGTP